MKENFWACGCGHSESISQGEVIQGRTFGLGTDEPGMQVYRDEPCPKCGGVMRMIVRSPIHFNLCNGVNDE